MESDNSTSQKFNLNKNMEKINCKIISVNCDDINVSKSVQEFGHVKNSDGNKSRYLDRRSKIKSFIEKTKVSNINFEIFDAVTPYDISFSNGNVIFEMMKLPVIQEDPFYVSNNLSHYKIWNMPEDTLILEDDILLEDATLDKILLSIDDFNKIDCDNKILYLQRSIPWIESLPDKSMVRKFSTSSVSESVSGDFSGTGAYFIKKECKDILLKNMRGLCACDKYLNMLKEDGIIKYYIPDINSMIKLDITSWL
jgi:GR25 family glycosyltransferase involved in LPS biosynthesis